MQNISEVETKKKVRSEMEEKGKGYKIEINLSAEAKAP